MGAPESSPSGLDASVLESLLALGDDALRVALSLQLQADFQRIRAALDSDEGIVVGRSAHELKGLAATVGANRLAEMARSVDSVAAGLAPAALTVIVAPLKREIDTVCEHVAQVSRSAPEA